MGKYRSGASTLVLGGQIVPPDSAFEHDFSETGPEGEYGPAREAAMLASGAIVKDEPAAAPDAGLAESTDTDAARAPRSRKRE